MTTITIPESLQSAFRVSEPTRVRDEQGNILGHYTPCREATEEDYEWAINNITQEQIDASMAIGPGRPLAEVLAELRAKYGP